MRYEFINQHKELYPTRVICQIMNIHQSGYYIWKKPFGDRWDEKYPQISRNWLSHAYNLNTLFNYPEDIHGVIYTANVIETINSIIRNVIKKRKLFPSGGLAKKVVFLAIQEASKK